MTHPITRRAWLKGWSAARVAKRWGITPRAFSRQAAKSSAQFVDAIAGLPNQGTYARSGNMGKMQITWGRFERGPGGHSWYPADVHATPAEQFKDNDKRGCFDHTTILNRSTYDNGHS